MAQPFESVREQLLLAGIAPRHASRYVTELREHLVDLTQRERAAGQDPTQAADRALALMGTDAELARAMIEKGTPRSLTARAPWVVFALSPIVVLVAMIAITGFSMMRVLWPVHGLTASEIPGNYRDLIAIVSFIDNYLVGALLAAGCIVVALRQRLASRWVWIGLCLIAISFNGLLGFHMHAIAPEGGHAGMTTYSAAGIVYLHGRVNPAATFGLAALHAVILFVVAAVAYRALQRRLVRVRA